MNSVPLSTKVLLVLLLVVGVRFFINLSGNSQVPQTTKQPLSAQKIKPSPVEQIFTCDEYKTKIRQCTSEAMVCLQEIQKSKKYHEQNEHKIIQCQSQNEKNLQINKQLKVKMQAVTQRLNQIVNRKNKNTENTPTTDL